jgi:hypothetical protein
MTKDDIAKDFYQVMTTVHELIDSESQGNNLVPIINLFLLGVVSITVDLVELDFPGSAPLIFAEVEAAAKSGGLRAIKAMQSTNGHSYYSVSGIEPDDMATAMNYLGQELSIALFKGMHELPTTLQKPEMWLRGIEAMLANLLSQKFDNPHEVLDSLCRHVHMALVDLESRPRFNH